MLFNSLGYILFLFIAIPIVWILSNKYKYYAIALFSISFYAMWKWEFVFLIIFSSIIDFYAGKYIFSELRQYKVGGDDQFFAMDPQSSPSTVLSNLPSERGRIGLWTSMSENPTLSEWCRNRNQHLGIVFAGWSNRPQALPFPTP